ncbi:MAG TPA: ABC transporter permease [Magnetospirillaceae bacterium]|jgi:ribose transport system permease protein/rhamnose transport system permease protein
MTAATTTMDTSHHGYDWRRLVSSQEAILLIALIGLFVVVGSINVRYLAERNVLDILLGNSYIAIAAIGMSMLIVSGNIDISVGSVIGVLGTISGTMAKAGYPVVITWLAPLVLGVLIFSFMGSIVAYLRIPSIVVTLGMLSILKGGLISVTGGTWITDLPENYHLSNFEFGDTVPLPVVLMIVFTLIAAYWMHYSGAGRTLYAVGGNPEAARLSGISQPRTTMMAFAIHGLFAGMAAVLWATQFRVIQSTTPPNLELTVITASVVGGVSILGGTGSVIGSTLAAVLIAAIGSSLIFVDISPYWLRAVQGALILITVLADLARRRRAARR